MRKIILSTFILSFFIYLITSAGATPYDYFTRLAWAFVNGKYWLTDNPPWLSELIPAEANRFYTVYPPFPAILLTPLVAIFGKSFPQQLLAHALGAGLSIIMAAISWNIKKDIRLAVWTWILTAFGCVLWYLSSTGSVWYLGQVTAAFLLSAALLESLTRKRVLLVGLFLGATYMSRVHTVLSLPIFIYLLRDNLKSVRGLVKLGAPIALFVGVDSFYNFVRFGVPWNNGYFLIPGTLDEPWFSKGIMHPSYIKEDLKIAFLRGPNFINKFPYVQPSWAGMAIWITTPAFIFSLWAKWKETVVRLSWLVILLIFLVVGAHGGTGFAQFGYRFAVDFYPFLLFLTIKGVVRMKGPKWYHWLLLLIGVTVNLWGVVWINKFGWVSY